MIKKLPESKGAVLGFEITAKVGLEEEKEWTAKFDQAIKKHGKISILVVLGNEAGWGVKTGIKDIKWVMTHMKNIHRLAFVTDSDIWEWLIKVDSQFAKMVGIGEKHFNTSEIDSAWVWVNE